MPWNHIGIDLLNDINRANSKNGEIYENIQLDAIKYFNKISELEYFIEQKQLKFERCKKFNGKTIIDYLNKNNISYDNHQISKHICDFNKYVLNKYKYDNFDVYLDNNNIISVQNDLINYLIN